MFCVLSVCRPICLRRYKRSRFESRSFTAALSTIATPRLFAVCFSPSFSNQPVNFSFAFRFPLECNPHGPLIISVTKLLPNSSGTRFFAFGRVFSGTVRTGQKVKILGSDFEVKKSGRIFFLFFVNEQASALDTNNVLFLATQFGTNNVLFLATQFGKKKDVFVKSVQRVAIQMAARHEVPLRHSRQLYNFNSQPILK